MSLTLAELRAHANPSNWDVREQYIATETIDGSPPVVIETQMIIAHNRVLRKTVDMPTSEFNAFFINVDSVNDNVDVTFNTDGSILSIKIAGATVSTV